MSKPKKSRLRKCHDGKNSFATLEQAQAAASDMARKKQRQGNPIVTYLRAYGCACGKFHFGRSKDIDWSKVK